jgi:hypothetical protein
MTNEWMPIDTAPTDCTDIMVWSVEYDRCLTVWLDEDGFFFCARNGDEIDSDGITHWMELPEAP